MDAGSDTSPAAPPRDVVSVTAVVFLGAAVLLRLAYTRFPVLYDADAYYHLAVARAYAERGMLHALDWARFSVLRDGFGDKELLFHVLLVPFVRLGDPTAGGFLALTLLGAAVAAVLAWSAVSAIGPWGAVIPFLVFGGAIDFTLRMVRLRPELLSLLLLLAAVSLAARRRAILLGVVGALYALSYTAFHAFLGLCVLFWLYGLWVERRNDWRLVVYPAVGVGLGLVVHPQFPANLRVWVAQNLDFFLQPAGPDVGVEIQSRTTRDTLVLNLGWLAGLVVLWRSRVPLRPPARESRLRDCTMLAAAVFAVLYLLMARFIIYLVPLATLAVVRSMQAAGEVPGPTTRLPWRGHVPFALAMGLCLASAVPLLWLGFTRMRASSARTFDPAMRADGEALGRAMPAGATVMAPWAASEEFVFWAPQGRYLNVLDPVFMRKKDPALYALSLDVFEGREPDIPLVAAARFDSEFYADDGQYPLALGRLRADPRVVALHEGITSLHRFLPDHNRDFLLDWQVLPADAPLPPPLTLLSDPATRAYPRASSPRERALEGYVDARRLGRADGCLTFARVAEVAAATRLALEIAPYGSADVFLDDAAVAVVPSRAAILGRGVILSLLLAPGAHRLAVHTCASGGHLGFYALVRAAVAP
jgi:hypothetical protein